MRYICITIALFLFVIAFGTTAKAAACDEEPINGVYYTSSFCWSNTGPHYSDGTIGSLRNDTARLQRALDKAVGKLVFDEALYYINNDLLIKHSYLIIEGTGRGRINPNPSYSATPTPTPTPAATPYPGPGANPTSDDPALNKSTRIIQTEANKSIFKIAENIYSISIRDMALVAADTTGTVGILIQGGPTSSGSPSVPNRTSLGFEFQNMTFTGFGKGIYVNAPHYGPDPDPPTVPDLTGQWQADHGRIDHALFTACLMGIHLNSSNSGWNMSSLQFLVPVEEGESIDKQTWGIYLERSTYANLNLLIGNGANQSGVRPTGFIRVERHANLTIQNATDEPDHFSKSLWVGLTGDEADLNAPVNISNNFFGNEVKIDNTTYVSTANQYGGMTPIRINANGASEVYSFGDKFCYEGYSCVLSGVDYSNFKMNDYSKLMASHTEKGTSFGERTTVRMPWWYDEPLLKVISSTYSGNSLFRLGLDSVYFDFTRDDVDGSLQIKGNQTCCNAISFKVGSSSEVRINTDGSVTYGSLAHTNLGSAANGTVVYCPDCNKATPCTSGGSGAIAKRLNGAWDCD